MNGNGSGNLTWKWLGGVLITLVLAGLGWMLTQMWAVTTAMENVLPRLQYQVDTNQQSYIRAMDAMTMATADLAVKVTAAQEAIQEMQKQQVTTAAIVTRNQDWILSQIYGNKAIKEARDAQMIGKRHR